MNNLQAKKDSNAFRKGEELKEAKEIAEKLKKITIKLTIKAGENGKLFGGVTSKEIAEALKKDFNIEIDKKKKAKLKIITALKDTTIKQIVLQAITNILENNTPITEHTTTRNRESLIIDVDATLKAKIKQHAYENNTKIRDIWIQAVDQIIKQNEIGELINDEKMI